MMFIFDNTEGSSYLYNKDNFITAKIKKNSGLNKG